MFSFSTVICKFKWYTLVYYGLPCAVSRLTPEKRSPKKLFIFFPKKPALQKFLISF